MTREPNPRGKGRLADIGYAWDREQWAKEIAENKKRQARKEAKEKKRPAVSSGLS